MSKEVIIVGAGGHTRALINVIELNNLRIIGIYDDSFNNNRECINSYELIGKISDLPNQGLVVLSIGDNNKRAHLFETYFDQIFKENIIHPSALIEKRTFLGKANQIFAHVYINMNAEIGDNNILNTGCIIEHETKIGSNNHISVGSLLCGRVKIGDRCFIGAGAVVIDRITICDDVTVGANSVVIENIMIPGRYAGNPVRKID